MQDNPASMVAFNYSPSGYQGFKEGSWYDVDPSAFVGVQYQPNDRDSPGASLVRAVLRGTLSEGNFAQYLIKPRLADAPTSPLELVVDPNPKGDVELTVVRCGHGNWNEVKTATDRLIYDVGASRWFTRTQVRALVASRNLASETRPISIVISHWDVDHFHALLEFEAAELAKIRVVFTPSQVPDTETFRRVRDRLTSHGVALSAQQPASSASKKITLHKHWQSGMFTMFRGTPGRSRNQTGIVLGVQRSNEVALLTGDHHYDKILEAAGKIAAYAHKPCVLVAPHHGGFAGKPSVAAWLAAFSTVTTPMSCGKNAYGHPTPAVQAALKAMQGGSQPWRTDLNGTWTKNLL